jgi:hypothetical protein
VIEGEGAALEGAVTASGLVEHWDVRLDPTLLDQPGEVGSIAIAGP